MPGSPDGADPGGAPTRKDGTPARTWLGHDPMLRLREWASDRVHPLPGPEAAEAIIGSLPSAAIHLVDPTGHVSRRHARLIRGRRGRWKLEDLRSRYGTTQDGSRATGRFRIVPGMEIGIGGITLVAENATLIGLRAYLARVLGWDAASLLTIDLALRSIRAAAQRRAQLLLVGVDDLVAVARQIHLRTHGATAPFVVCSPQPHESDASIRVTTTMTDAGAAFPRAAGGIVCVRAHELPVGFPALLEATLHALAPAQLTACARKASQRGDVQGQPILIPPLAHRPAEDLERIVREYASDAAAELGVSPDLFTDEHRRWVLRQEAASWADIEVATLRLFARIATGSVHQAAARLGLTHVGLGGWFRRREPVP